MSASRKDRVEPFTHAITVGELVGKAESLKGADTPHEIAHPERGDRPVHRAGLVADADAHGVATAGQHRRAIAQGFASAREAMAHRHRQQTQPTREAVTWLRTFLAAPCGMSGCNVPEGECSGACLESTR